MRRSVKQNSFCHLASSVRGLRDGERGLLFSLTSVEVKAAITKSGTELRVELNITFDLVLTTNLQL